MITLKQFKDMYPKCKNPTEWVEVLSQLLPRHRIDTPSRIAAFISQCGHESAGWSRFSENLNYTATRLNEVFPKYFKNAGRNAVGYHREPEKIANMVYQDRMGNDSSGDGYRYRGRGPIQLTGKNNYKAFTKDTGIDVVTYPDLLVDNVEVSLKSAIWFWETNQLNKYADYSDVKELTKKINGSTRGLAQRLLAHDKLYLMLTGETDKYEITGVFKLGSSGKSVKAIQRQFGLTQDGKFGKLTEFIVKRWQRDFGLLVDGTIGPESIKILFG